MSERKAEGFTMKPKGIHAVVMGRPKARAFQEKAVKPNFRESCVSGDIPIALTHVTKGNGVRWKVDFERIDYHHFLPLFFQGLAETTHPYEKLANQGIHGMLDHCGQEIINIVPQLIPHIKNALNTRNDRVMCNTLQVLQHMVMSAHRVGEALVPYFRQILRWFNLFGPKKDNVADLLKRTLEIFERYGGKDAFHHIKSVIPTYESCMK
ncbi:parkin coregulated gene protein-like [Cololabis saira]|uniref:parkin coregulated gene protein-like n=1 Tax=Cololabis saira TaxID=129043 RepID=UPI002AD3A58B|nr:parkin coregulated gene protein-like [Cololabis saira]